MIKDEGGIEAMVQAAVKTKKPIAKSKPAPTENPEPTVTEPVVTLGKDKLLLHIDPDKQNDMLESNEKARFRLTVENRGREDKLVVFAVVRVKVLDPADSDPDSID